VRSLLPQVVTILRYTEGAVDAFGNPAASWVADTTTYPGRLRRTPDRTSESEIPSAGERGVTSWTLYMEGSVPLSPRDRVQVEGTTYELDGDPYYVYGSRDVHHLEARLRGFGG